MNLLDADQIRRAISAESKSRMDDLEVFAEIESTNSYLLERPAPPPGRFRVATAEHQTAGRGRLDRRWQSPPSTGICMSLAYTFGSDVGNIPCLTLAVGVGVVGALEHLGIDGVALKWPNDIMLGDGKLGGILTEARASNSSQLTVVVGVGINVDLGDARINGQVTSQLGRVSDLSSCAGGAPSRSMLSTALIEHLFNTVSGFEERGFPPFEDAWQKLDWLRGQHVRIEQGAGVVDGVCQGIDSDGALFLETESGRERIVSGSVIPQRQKVAV